MRPRFLGPAENNSEQTASPLHHVRPAAPPFLVSYGSDDFPHLRQQALDFVAAMRAEDNEVTACELANCDHLGASYASGDANSGWPAHAAAWMRAH